MKSWRKRDRFLREAGGAVMLWLVMRRRMCATNESHDTGKSISDVQNHSYMDTTFVASNEQVVLVLQQKCRE